MLLTVPLEIDPSNGCEAVRYHFNVDVSVNEYRESLEYDITSALLAGIVIVCDCGPRSEIHVNEDSPLPDGEWCEWIRRIVSTNVLIRSDLTSEVRKAIERELDQRAYMPSGD